MPVYEVTVSRYASVTDTVTVQAEDEISARIAAEEQANACFDMENFETQTDSVRELSADEALSADNVVTA